MTLHSASAVSMIRHTDHLSSLVLPIKNEFFPQTVPAGFVCSGQAVPNEKSCMCPEAKLGLQMGQLCNCLDVMQRDMQSRQLMTTAP